MNVQPLMEALYPPQIRVSEREYIRVEKVLAAELGGLPAVRRIRCLADLEDVKPGAVLIDRWGMAYQAILLGQPPVIRVGFVQAGNHVTFERDQLFGVLPMRLVDDGRMEE